MIYVVDSVTGAIKTNLRYHPVDSPSFGGTFQLADIDSDGYPDLVRANASAYLKDITVFRNTGG